MARTFLSYFLPSLAHKQNTPPKTILATLEKSQRNGLILVAFGDGLSWYRRILRPGFGHVCTMMSLGSISSDGTVKPDDQREWLTLEWTSSRGIWWGKPQCSLTNIVEKLTQHGYHVAEVSPRFFTKGGYWWPGLVNCVGLSKQILGVRSVSIQTPWQLFKFLQRQREVTIWLPSHDFSAHTHKKGLSL